MVNRTRQSRHLFGFTLIELSIVLVIIGLIAGGVLVGRDMIIASQVRKTGTLIEQLDTAANTFKSKYNCLPGDCANAIQFGLAANGNGDGDVFGVDGFGNANAGTENYQFFQMLISSNLIADLRYCKIHNITCQPIYAMINWGLKIPVSHRTNGSNNWSSVIGMVSLMHATPLSGININGMRHAYFFGVNSRGGDSAISPSVMFMLDSKFDDGYPLSGKMQALGFLSGTQIANGAYGNSGQFYLAPTLCNNVLVNPSVYSDSNEYNCSVMWSSGF